MPIDLHISVGLEKRCRDWCKRWFPREAYGFLLGTRRGNVVRVGAVWLPSASDAEDCFKKDRLFFKSSWVDELQEAADEDESVVVGDFHSHPYLRGEARMDPIQSALDLDAAGKHAIFGVVNVEERSDGTLRTRVRWWGPSIRVRVRRIP
jgi:proteasome lid subunit RPN8/RPN11